MSKAVSLIPAALGADQEALDALYVFVDKVAANCGLSNGQVLDVICVALWACTEAGARDDFKLVKVADMFADKLVEVAR